MIDRRALAAGWIGTAMPLLFILFFLSACLNLPGLLAIAVSCAAAQTSAGQPWTGLMANQARPPATTR